MRPQKIESLAYFVISFVVLLAVGVTMRDGGSQPHVLANINHILDGTSDINDPGSFALGAKDIYQHGWFTTANMWLIHLWPPGFMLLEGAILKIFGLDAPMVLILQIVACVPLAAMMLLQRTLLKPMVGGLAASVLPLSILTLPVARHFLLEPFGVILGETYSVSLFISSIMLVMLAMEQNRVRHAVAGGICLALAAYFRSQYELLAMAATVLAIPMVTWLLIARPDAQARKQRVGKLSMIRIVVAFILAANMLMLPWRIHNKIDAGSFRWVQTMDIVAQNSLSTSQDLLAKGGSFVIAGGGNLSCVFEPSYCGSTDTHLFLGAFTRHIPEWEAVKASLAGKYWFSSLKNAGLVRYPATTSDIVWNTVLLVFVFAIIPLLLAIRTYVGFPILLWINLSFFGPFFVIFSLIPFETRYFYLVKLFSFTMSILLACIAWGQRVSRGRPLPMT